MIYIVIIVVLLIIIPKHNKAEKEASHLFIDTYQIPVKKINNPIRQMYLLEKQFNIEGIKSYHRRTNWIVLGSIFSGFVLMIFGVYYGLDPAASNLIITGILAFSGLILLIGGVIYSYVRLYKLHSTVRPNSWRQLFKAADPEIDTSFLQHKNWQKALLVALVEAKA